MYRDDKNYDLNGWLFGCDMLPGFDRLNSARNLLSRNFEYLCIRGSITDNFTEPRLFLYESANKVHATVR